MQPLKINSRINFQKGLTLIESLVAIAILALGVLAMLGTQLSVLAETQNSVRRSQSIRVLEDLSERMKSNPITKENSNEKLKLFLLRTDDTWINKASDLNGCPQTISSNTTFNENDLINYDRCTWATTALELLPEGSKIKTFVNQTGGALTTQLGIGIAWLNRSHNKKGKLPPPPNPSNNSNNIQCPVGMSCHFLYVHS